MKFTQDRLPSKLDVFLIFQKKSQHTGCVSKVLYFNRSRIPGLIDVDKTSVLDLLIFPSHLVHTQMDHFRKVYVISFDFMRTV